MKHKHYDLMVQWLGDQTLELEYKTSGVWVTANPLNDNPVTDPHPEWRIKPRMVKVGRHEWPMPLSDEPAEWTVYWVAYSGSVSMCKWTNHDTDLSRLRGGVIHLTEEAAQQHADALVAINRGDV